LSDAAWQEIAQRLSPTELALFQRYRLPDQRHTYRVFSSLEDAGETHPALLTAALLHDVGKTEQAVPLWARSLAVLGEKLAPHRAAGWAQGEPAGWRRAFQLKNQHAAWGAEMAAAAGSDPLTVYLIRHHQDTQPENTRSFEDRLLVALMWADDRN
jgi:hypothetical protein